MQRAPTLSNTAHLPRRISRAALLLASVGGLAFCVLMLPASRAQASDSASPLSAATGVVTGAADNAKSATGKVVEHASTPAGEAIGSVGSTATNATSGSNVSSSEATPKSSEATPNAAQALEQTAANVVGGASANVVGGASANVVGGASANVVGGASSTVGKLGSAAASSNQAMGSDTADVVGVVRNVAASASPSNVTRTVSGAISTLGGGAGRSLAQVSGPTASAATELVSRVIDATTRADEERLGAGVVRGGSSTPPPTAGPQQLAAGLASRLSSRAAQQTQTATRTPAALPLPSAGEQPGGHAPASARTLTTSLTPPSSSHGGSGLPPAAAVGAQPTGTSSSQVPAPAALAASPRNDSPPPSGCGVPVVTGILTQRCPQSPSRTGAAHTGTADAIPAASASASTGTTRASVPLLGDAIGAVLAGHAQEAPAPTGGAGSPGPSPMAPDGGSGAGAAAFGFALLIFSTLAGLLMVAAPSMMRRLLLASERWRPALFVLAPERPG